VNQGLAHERHRRERELVCAFIHLAPIVEIRDDSLAVGALSLVRRILLCFNTLLAGTQMTIVVACDLLQRTWRISVFDLIAVQRFPDEWLAD
jgi:hypothetical protein